MRRGDAMERGALTFPPAPFLSPAGGEEGGGWLLQWSGNRWQVTHASRRRDGTGALTFPPAPFLSPAGGEEGGDGSPRIFSLAPVCSAAGGEEGGMGVSASSPWLPSAPPLGARKGGRGVPAPSPWLPFARVRGNVGVAGAKERWKSLTQWLHGYGMYPMRNPGFDKALRQYKLQNDNSEMSLRFPKGTRPAATGNFAAQFEHRSIGGQNGKRFTRWQSCQCGIECRGEIIDDSNGFGSNTSIIET